MKMSKITGFGCPLLYHYQISYMTDRQFTPIFVQIFFVITDKQNYLEIQLY